MYTANHEDFLSRLQLQWIRGRANLLKIAPHQRSKFWLSVRLDNQKSHRTTKNIDTVFWRTTMNLWPKCSFKRVYIPSTDNQKLGRSTRNCNLVVHGTTIYFSFIRTLLLTLLPCHYMISFLINCSIIQLIIFYFKFAQIALESSLFTPAPSKLLMNIFLTSICQATEV